MQAIIFVKTKLLIIGMSLITGRVNISCINRSPVSGPNAQKEAIPFRLVFLYRKANLHPFSIQINLSMIL
jgi:hypothetical protein